MTDAEQEEKAKQMVISGEAENYAAALLVLAKAQEDREDMDRWDGGW